MCLQVRCSLTKLFQSWLYFMERSCSSCKWVKHWNGLCTVQGFESMASPGTAASNAAPGHREQQSGSIQPIVNFSYWAADSHLGFGVWPGFHTFGRRGRRILGPKRNIFLFVSPFCWSQSTKLGRECLNIFCWQLEVQSLKKTWLWIQYL